MKDETRILHLSLKKRWFDMILSGEKKEEYRELKPFWQTRLVKTGYWHTQECVEFDYVHFTNGYGGDKPQIIIECKGISVVDSGNIKWGFEDRCFGIKLGEIIKTINT